VCVCELIFVCMVVCVCTLVCVHGYLCVCVCVRACVSARLQGHLWESVNNTHANLLSGSGHSGMRGSDILTDSKEQGAITVVI
jgi:hypothetical protein